MIQTQNSNTRSISRLDSIMSELVNDYRNVKILSYHPLINPYTPTLSIGPKNHIILKTKIQFYHTHLNLTKLQVLRPR